MTYTVQVEVNGEILTAYHGPDRADAERIAFLQLLDGHIVVAEQFDRRPEEP